MGEEQRASPRKNLRRPATVVLADSRKVRAQTVDVSENGICLLLPEQPGNGQTLNVAFEIPIRGEHRSVILRAKVMYTVCVGMQGFRAGMQIMDIDDASMSTLNTFLG